MGYTILMLWFRKKSISTFHFIRNQLDELRPWQGSSFFTRQAMRNRQFPLEYTILICCFREKSISTLRFLGYHQDKLRPWQGFSFFLRRLTGNEKWVVPLGYMILMLWFRKKNISTLHFLEINGTSHELWVVLTRIHDIDSLVFRKKKKFNPSFC